MALTEKEIDELCERAQKDIRITDEEVEDIKRSLGSDATMGDFLNEYKKRYPEGYKKSKFQQPR